MGKRDIEVHLSQVGVRQAIDELEEYEREMNEKLNDLIGRLGQLGLTIIQTKLLRWDYAGSYDVNVTTEFIDNKCIIKASGKDVAFIEFGTGILYPEGEYASIAGASPHGTYGAGKAANPHGWFYKGEQGSSLVSEATKRPGVYHTYGYEPANAFPDAVKEIQEQATTIANEVFR